MQLFLHPAVLAAGFAAASVGFAFGYAVRAKISARRRRRAWRGF
jgi:hypothetical protein